MGGLSTTNLDANRGGDATRVFAGALGGSTSGEVPPGPDTRLTFAWSGAFRYDPSRGNLLIDIRKTGGVFFGDHGTYLDFDGSGAARIR